MLRIISVWLLAFCLAAGCTDPNVGGNRWKCAVDDDCLDGFECMDGECRHPDAQCSPLGATRCEGDLVSVCQDSGTGGLEWSEPEACNDDNPCTDDVCVAGLGCTSEPVQDGSPCDDDGFFCSGVETCSGGVCTSDGNPCNPPDSCDEDADLCGGCGDGEVIGSEECDPGVPQNDNCCDVATCIWVGPDDTDPQAVCSGALDCQLDVCDGAGACTTVPADDGTACSDDGLFCTGNEICQLGDCTSVGNPCDPPDSCDEDADLCAGCGDGEVIGMEQCDPGVPQNDNCCDAATCLWVGPGDTDPQAVCSGASECQVDVCDGSGGCGRGDMDDGVSCGDATDRPCDDPDTCLNGQCEINLAVVGTLCRSSTDDCDVEEVCDGVNPDCPQDLVVGVGVVCRPAVGVCDTEETCNGVSVNCPPDLRAPVDTECRASTDGGDCDPAESCDGVAVDCPDDVLEWDGKPCHDDGFFCTGLETCLLGVCTSEGNPCPAAVICDEPHGICGACGDGVVEAGEDCDPGAPRSDNCCNVGNCSWTAPGLVDPQLVCSGAPDCRVDVCDGGGGCTVVVADDGADCGSNSDTLCDNPDTCLAGVCQDNLEGNAQLCRSSAGLCDPGEYCDGSSPDCPEDLLSDESTECRISAGGCDPAEFCDGSTALCPGNVLADFGDECRAAAGLCDLAEVCDGVVASCPSDTLEGAGTECRASAGLCDSAEVCDGVLATCPVDGYTAEFTPCTDTDTSDCLLAECNAVGVCVQDYDYAVLGTPCDAGDPCLTGDTCGDGDGICNEGAGTKDSDGDTYVDIACPAGDDCDDMDPNVYPNAPAEGPGNICDADGSCFDGIDNDCDGNIDGADPDCVVTDYMCLYGPGSDLTTNGPGGTITVRLDTSGYDTGDIVCYTDSARLLTPTDLLSNDFESDMTGFTVSDAGWVERGGWAQNPATSPPGANGVSICYTNWLMTNAIDTRGRTRIQLRYASTVSVQLDANEYMFTDYSTDGSTWYQLDIQGDDFREQWQWFTHILPPRCENESTLYIRWGVAPASSGTDCAFIDDVEIVDLPDPTVGWTLLANDFEPASGNATADICADESSWLLALFDNVDTNMEEICLLNEAQNPATLGDQGIRINENDPNWIRDTAIDTQYVPAGSDLVAGFFMQSVDQGGNDYSNGWYSYDGGTTWKRLNGVGLDGRVDYDWFRFVMDPGAIGLTDLMLEFLIPTAAGNGGGDSFYLDDYNLTWYRASHDLITGFTDEGDGTYTATITSDLSGIADVNCIYHGASGTEVTDGLDWNSPSLPLVFMTPP